MKRRLLEENCLAIHSGPESLEERMLLTSPDSAESTTNRQAVTEEDLNIAKEDAQTDGQMEGAPDR